METTNEHNSYLCGLISIVPVLHRMPRVDSTDANLKDITCKYKVRHVLNRITTEYKICQKAFSAIHGIPNKQDQFLINSFKMAGSSPKDQRATHLNSILKWMLCLMRNYKWLKII